MTKRISIYCKYIYQKIKYFFTCCVGQTETCAKSDDLFLHI